jgi:hypothetical protein
MEGIGDIEGNGHFEVTPSGDGWALVVLPCPTCLWWSILDVFISFPCIHVLPDTRWNHIIENKILE